MEYNHKDPVLKKVLSELKMKKNVFLSAIPGMGLNTFTKDVKEEYIKLHNAYSIDIYSHETIFAENLSVDRLILEKFKIQNNYEAKNINTTNELINYILLSKKPVLITLHKINMFQNTSRIISYLTSMRESSQKFIVVLADGSISQNDVTKELFYSTTFYMHYYKGVIEGFGNLVDNLSQRYGLGILDPKIKTEIYNKCLGHTGLIISVIDSFSEKGSLQSNYELLKKFDIKKRLGEIFDSLALFKDSLNNFGQKGSDPILEELGITVNFKTGTLLSDYYDSVYKLKETKYNDLTEMEYKIFQLLENRNNTYLSIEEILSYVGKDKFYESSDWAIYKHVNNLKKKLNKYGMDVKSKRGVGYRLVKG